MRIQKERLARRPEQEVPQDRPRKSTEALKADLDSLLDEIDSVLEENAEEFVKSYVQRGGQ